MKKLLIAIMAILFVGTLSVVPTTEVGAQVVNKIKPVKDSTVNTDTTYIDLAFDNQVRSITVDLTRASGTISGNKVYLQSTVDGTTWYTLDSLVLSNSVKNQKLFPVTTTGYSLLNYQRSRFQVLGAGNNKIKPVQAYVIKRG